MFSRVFNNFEKLGGDEATRKPTFNETNNTKLFIKTGFLAGELTLESGASL